MSGSRGPQRVVIVGGGVIGAACAHYLSTTDADVTVLDANTFGAACSHGNCGYICPSHVLPLAEPGAVRGTLGALFKRNSPFAIKFRFDLALWLWLYRFARRCNERDMYAAARGIAPLLESSLALYQELVEEDGLECEWEERGLLYVYQTGAALEAYQKTDDILAEHFGHGAQRMSRDELLDFEPALKPDVAGAWYHEHDAHLRSDVLMQSWRRLLESRGVTVRDACPADAVVREGRRAVAVRTPEGDIEADAVVFATGAVTPRLSEMIGRKLPIQPGKGYSITMPRPSVCPTTPMIFQEHRVAVTPFQSGYRIGSTMEFAGYDESIKEARLRLLTEGAALYLQEPTAEPIVDRWFGWRPMTTDSLPYIGPVEPGGNVFVAAGHNMLGLSMATGTGLLIRQLITGEDPHLDPTPYRVDR